MPENRDDAPDVIFENRPAGIDAKLVQFLNVASNIPSFPVAI